VNDGRELYTIYYILHTIYLILYTYFWPTLYIGLKSHISVLFMKSDQKVG